MIRTEWLNLLFREMISEDYSRYYILKDEVYNDDTT